MPISWVDSDGKSGISENSYEYAVQSADREQAQPAAGPSTEAQTQSRDDIVDQNQAWLGDLVHEYTGKVSKALGISTIEDKQNWAVKEHLGDMINTAMSVMGAGYRGPPRITTIETPSGYRPFLSEGPTPKAANQNRTAEIRQAEYDKEWEELGKMLKPGTEERALMIQRLRRQIKEVPKEEGLITETQPQLQQARDLRGQGSDIKWPEGWGVKMPEGSKFASAEYPHVQRAFKEAMEAGNTTIPEIIDHMTLNGTPTTYGIIQSLRKKAGLTQQATEQWSSEKTNTFTDLVKSGKTDDEISETMGITKNAIIGKANRLGLDITPITRNTMLEKVDKVRELADKGMPANAIAEELGHHPSYVRMLARTAEIDLPRDTNSPGGGARRKTIIESTWRQTLKKRLDARENKE